MSYRLERFARWSVLFKGRYAAAIWVVMWTLPVPGLVFRYFVIPNFVIPELSKLDEQNYSSLRRKYQKLRKQFGQRLASANKEEREEWEAAQARFTKLHGLNSSILSLLEAQASNDVDAVYHFEKQYKLPSSGQASLKETALKQYFYAKPGDRIFLSAWVSGSLTSISVQVNLGTWYTLKSKFIRHQGKNGWIDVDITDLVKNDPLVSPLSPALPEGVNMVAIRPYKPEGGNAKSYHIHGLIIVKKAPIEVSQRALLAKGP